MLTFAVVAAKRGRPVSQDVLDLLGRRSPPEVPFDPTEHVVWTDRRRSVAFGGWQASADLLGVGSHWSVGPDGVTAFSGMPRVRGESPPTASWAEHLAATVAGLDAPAVSEAVAGMYSVVSIGDGGDGFVVSDPLGICLLFVAETDDVVVVSSRAVLAASLVTAPGLQPRRDARAVASLVYLGHIIDDRTGFEAVRTLPHGSGFEIGSGHDPRIRTWDERPWLPGDIGPGDMDLDEAVAVSRADVGDAVRWVAGRDDQVRIMELTGGKDSRVVFSTALAEGIADRFTCVTWGPPHLPDQQVVAELVERYGLTHRTKAPVSDAGLARRRAARAGGGPQPLPPVPTRILHHVWLTSGGANAWDRRPVLELQDSQMWMSGGFGEGLRTNYRKLIGLGSMDELDDLVRGDGFRADALGLLLPEARQLFDDVRMESLEAARPPGGDPQDAIDGDYLIRRMRRWLGPMQEIEFRNRIFPLYSLPSIRAAFGIGVEARMAEKLPFGIVRSVDPDLARHRLASDSWPEGAWSGLPDAEAHRSVHPPISHKRPRGAKAKAKAGRRMLPKRAARAGAGEKASTTRASRRAEEAEALPLIRHLTDLPPSHPLFDWLDRTAVHQAVDRFDELRVPELKGVYAALTAALWIDGAEERHRRTG